MPSPQTAVIFDMDGVIFDTERLLIDCWKPVAASRGIEHIEEVCHRCLGVTKEQTRKTFFDFYGKDFPFDDCQKELFAIFRERGKNGFPVKKGVRELLTFLNRNGIPCAIASSTSTRLVLSELEQVGLLSYFTTVTGGDQVTKSKPDPEIFLKACSTLSVDPSRCFGIEDSYNGLRSLRAAGLTSIMVPDLLLPSEEVPCDYIFPDLLAVKDFFAGILSL